MNKWRLSRTLRRPLDVRPISESDLKYLWASYKKGSLKSLRGAFATDDLTPDKFKDALADLALAVTEIWTISAHVGDERRPIGIVLGSAAPSVPFWTIVGVVWMPWATKRNIIEGCVGFFDRMRRQVALMGVAAGDHKRLYEVCCMHSVLRRVGTSMVAIQGESAAMYETRNI